MSVRSLRGTTGYTSSILTWKKLRTGLRAIVEHESNESVPRVRGLNTLHRTARVRLDQIRFGSPGDFSEPKLNAFLLQKRIGKSSAEIARLASQVLQDWNYHSQVWRRLRDTIRSRREELFFRGGKFYAAPHLLKKRELSAKCKGGLHRRE
jgi:hypothetical protein